MLRAAALLLFSVHLLAAQVTVAGRFWMRTASRWREPASSFAHPA